MQEASKLKREICKMQSCTKGVLDHVFNEPSKVVHTQDCKLLASSSDYMAHGVWMEVRGIQVRANDRRRRLQAVH
eukprot:6328187-Amphidinium_carterae.1